MEVVLVKKLNQEKRKQVPSSLIETQGASAGFPLFLNHHRSAPEQVAALGKTTTPTAVLPVENGEHFVSSPIRIFDSPASHRAAAELGAYAYSWQGDIFLGSELGQSGTPSRANAIHHEKIHALQARNSGHHAHESALETEAHNSSIQTPRLTANPNTVMGWWFVIPLLAGAYVLLRPNVANAPAPDDPLVKSTSEFQVAGEALALFAVPAGVASVLGRLGFGVIASFALSGAASSISYRGVQDVGRGEFSGIEAYVVDATTGLVIGAIVGGVFRPFISMPGAVRPNPSLIHLTDSAGQSGITTSGALRGSQGIYALPSHTVSEGTAMRVLRTLLRPSQTSHVVSVPENASGLFRQPLPIGPLSTYQRLMGVSRTPAGSISMLTGDFAASGNSLANITGQFFPYGIDGLLWISAGCNG